MIAARVALVISSLGSIRAGGGAARAMSLLANRWASAGRAVKFFVLDVATDRPFYPLHEAIEVAWIDRPGSRALVPHLIRIGRRTRRLRAGFKAFRPDVIVSFLTGTNVNALVAARGLGIPVVVSDRADPTTFPVGQPFRLLRACTYPWADAIVVQSEQAASFFAASLRPKVWLVPNVVTAHPQPKRVHAEQADRLLSIGRLHVFKDYEIAIEALSRLKTSHPRVSLTIYGEGLERPALTALIRARGLESRVSLPGFVGSVSETLTSFDLFVFPSRSEGFPNAVGEALAAGLPMVATAAAGTAVLVQDGVNGRLCPTGDVDALAALIAELHGDRAQREALSRAAVEVSQTFSAERIGALWERLFASVAGR